MERFSLYKWLQDKSRKVFTRDGRLVRIICTDRKARSGNIVGLVGEDESIIYVWQNDGTHAVSGIDANDLFFADEEKELTEFEKAIYQYICAIVTACDGNVYGDGELKPIVKEIAKDLLGLARNEIEKVDWKTSLSSYKNGYEQGKQDALKDFPKWKKSTLPIPDEEYPTGFNGKYFCYKGYCVDYEKLFETLPKEETDE